MAYSKELLKSELVRDELLSKKRYKDSVGIWTVGVGHNLEAKALCQQAIDAQLDHGLCREAVMAQLEFDIVIAENTATIVWSGWPGMSDVRQRVFLNMAFNMGAMRLSGFRKFIAALKIGDYATAAKEMDSKWSLQVGPRADRLKQMMLDG